MLVVCYNTFEALGRSPKLTRQRCHDILFESHQRENTLTEIRLENELQGALKWRQENNDITKSCIASGDYLLTLHENALQELLTDRDALLKTIETMNILRILQS